METNENKNPNQAEQKNDVKESKRFSPKERRSLLKEYHAARKEGMNTDKAAEKVSVPYITLRTWERKTEVEKKLAEKPKLARGSKPRKAKVARKAKKAKRAHKSKAGRPQGSRNKVARTVTAPVSNLINVTRSDGTKIEGTIENVAALLNALR
jgi:hypothetical protein